MQLPDSSYLITGISGAHANHAKKHTKNASQDIWNARMAGVEKLNNLISVAFFASRLIFEDIRRPPELNEILICMTN